MSTVFNISNKNHMQHTLFFDDNLSIARFDVVKYPFLEKLTEKQMGFFWQPTEVDLTRDKKDFNALSAHEQHIFTSNIKRQIVLDSVQGRAPTAAFTPIASLPELENWIIAWAFSETIHSRSYTHVIRNVYANPSVVFDGILDIPEIMECAGDISKYYDELIRYNNLSNLYGDNLFGHNVPAWKGMTYNDVWNYNHKKALWLALMSVNILEGIRFYASFACSWAFAELKKMEGNAKIIKLIARDENLHLAGTQQLLKTLPQDDPDFAKIRDETREQCINLYISACDQEKAWAKYLFKNGSVIGLNEELLCSYVEWITNKRLQAVGFPSQYKVTSNPLPWTQKWISGGDVQVAPQETEISSYIVGGINNDVSINILQSMSL